MPMPDADTIEVPEAVAEYINELETANDELNTALEAQLAKADAGDDDDDDDPAEVIKSLIEKSIDDTERERLSKALESVVQAKADAAEAKEIAKAEQDARITREFISKAAELDSIAANPIELGAILKAASEALSDEQFDALSGILKAANEAVKQGSLYEELGKASDPNHVDTDDPLMAAAAKIMQSDGVDRFTAIAKAVDQDPTLYNRKDI